MNERKKKSMEATKNNLEIEFHMHKEMAVPVLFLDLKRYSIFAKIRGKSKCKRQCNNSEREKKKKKTNTTRRRKKN